MMCGESVSLIRINFSGGIAARRGLRVKVEGSDVRNGLMD
jgi:hypothetical protein